MAGAACDLTPCQVASTPISQYLDSVSSQKSTRSRILDAALAALQEDPRDVNVSRVAGLAGISRQAVYLHFQDKSQLLIAAARHVDERLDLKRRLLPLGSAQTAEVLLTRHALFLADYNPLLYPVVRAADSVRKSDAAVERAWLDRLRHRRRGCRSIARQLADWKRLAPEWTVPNAGDWLTSQASVKLWEELVIDLGWSRRRYVDSMTRVLVRTLLR